MVDRCSNGINCRGASPNEYDLDVLKLQSVGQKHKSVSNTNLYHVNEVSFLRHLFHFPVLFELRSGHLVPAKCDVI